MYLLDSLGWLGPARPSCSRFGAELERVRSETRALVGVPEAELARRTDVLRQTAGECGQTRDFKAEAVALAAEAIRRAHGLKAHEEQLLAGLVLADGRLAEMATGEGKTLVALLPALAWAVHGRGVHLATVNRYLAERDCEFAARAFALLSVSVAALPEQRPAAEKRIAYTADVTYGVGTEFGFDYLRDQLTLRAHRALHRPARYHDVLLGRVPPPPELAQRRLAYAVIDEADSVLIDEARSPLVIATGAPRPSSTPEVYLLACRLAQEFRETEEFRRDPQTRVLSLTPAGHERAVAALGEELLPQLLRRWPRYVEQALRARHEFQRDVHYLVADGKVVIVDEFTGRPCPERTWREGLHQAIEAQASLTVTEENNSEATITRPAYFRLYQQVCGMTGTAREVAAELREIYRLRTSVIPLHRPCRRVRLPDRVFATRAEKLAAVVQEVLARRARGQPVLIGTRTVEASEALAEVFARCEFPFFLLNAKQDAEEAQIIAFAGTPGAVTIATNMAGRGAHIPVSEESQRAGGLYVIGLELHESARIDRQLIGRAARQGEPGACQFFLSLEDDLIRRYAPALARRWQGRARSGSGELPDRLARHFHRLQRRVEAADRQARAALAEHDRHVDELKQIL